MKLGYKLSVLGVVVMLLALSAYVVLGVDSGATEEYDPSVMQGIFLERDGAADNFKEGIWVILDTGLYVWLDYLEDETYSQNPDTLGEFIHWDSINGAEILNYNLGYERDYRSSGIMKIRYQFDPDFILYVEVFATAPPNPEIARFVSENIIGLSNDQSGFNIPVPPSSSQPSQPSQVSATATSTFTELTCEDTQSCKEVDQVWNLISPYVNKHQGEVYKPESATSGEWVPFTTLYPVPVSSSGGSGGSGGYASGSAIASLALQEYEDWGRSTKDECLPERLPALTKYWAILGRTDFGCNGPTDAWSAAFISYVLKTAGVTDFPVASYHTTYFSSIRDNPQKYSCSTFPMTQKDKIKVGDVVCYCRGVTCQNLNYQTIPAGNIGHCDIVVSTDSGTIETLGGNRGGTVKKSPANLDDPTYFGFISCEESGGSSSVSATGSVGTFRVGTKTVSCAANLDDPYKNAFLDTVAWAEGLGASYNKMFTGKIFTNFDAHPVETSEMPDGGIYSGDTHKVYSTASGRYQFVYSTGYTFAKNAGFFPPFTPIQQDKAAWHLASVKGLTEVHLSDALRTNDFKIVSDIVASTWASFPYSPNSCGRPNKNNQCDDSCLNKNSKKQCGSGNSYYGQGHKSKEDLFAVFKTCYDYHSTKAVS